MRFSITLWLFLFLFQNTLGQTGVSKLIFVSPTGNDANSGDVNSPVKTISYAIKIANSTDTILLKEGIYAERVIIGLNKRPLTIASEYIFRSDTSIISKTIVDASSITNVTTLLDSSAVLLDTTKYRGYLNFIGFTIRGSKTSIIENTNRLKFRNMLFTQNIPFQSAYQFLNVSRTVFDSCRFIGNGSLQGAQSFGILDLKDSSVVRSSIFTDNIGNGSILKLSNSNFRDSLVISGNLIKSNIRQSQGPCLPVIWVGFSSDIRINNNVIYNNASGVLVDNTSLDGILSFSNNTFINNLTTASLYPFNIDSRTRGEILLFNNIIQNNTSENYTNQIGILNASQTFGYPALRLYHNVVGTDSSSSTIANNSLLSSLLNVSTYTQKIVYRDTLKNDFRLADFSAGIGYGTSQYSLSLNPKDFDERPRPNPAGSNPDLGAFENSFAYSAPKLKSAEVGNKRVTLYWDNIVVPGLVKYKIFRSTSPIPDNATTNLLTDTLKIGALTYTDTTALINLTKYYYRIKVVDTSGLESALSNEISLRPNLEPPVVSNLQAEGGPASILVKWTSTSKAGITYSIYRSLDSLAANASIIKATLSDTIFLDTTAVKAVSKYYYWVKAVDSVGAVSNFSAFVSSNIIPIWYVSPLGSDTNSGSINQPVKTVGFAIRKLVNGDTISVRAGSYVESLNSLGKLFILRGESGADSTIINLAYNVTQEFPSPGLTIPPIQNVNPDVNIQVKGITFKPYDSKAFVIIGNSPIFSNCIFRDFLDYLFDNPGAAQFINCLFLKNGILFRNNGFTAQSTYLNCTFTKNQAITISYEITGARPLIMNSILTYTGNYTDTTKKSFLPKGMNIIHSIVDDSIYSKINENSGIRPLFIDEDNYRLQISSNGIGMGLSSYTYNSKIYNAPTFDFDNKPRPNPNGSRPDVGCYENEAASPSPFITMVDLSGSKVQINFEQYKAVAIIKYYIYRSIGSSALTLYDSTTSANSYTDDLGGITNQYVYYNIKSLDVNGMQSDLSNRVKVIQFTPPVLVSPSNGTLKTDTTLVFKWRKIDLASYTHQVSEDSTFKNSVSQRGVSDTSVQIGGLVPNRTYYWRVAATDSVFTGNWSNRNAFQTFVSAPIIDSIVSVNKKLVLNWKNIEASKIRLIKIYRDDFNNNRDTLGPLTQLIDSVSSSVNSYKDTSQLIVGKRYYYRIVAVNNNNIESDFSNLRSQVPVNTKPTAAVLAPKSYTNVGEFNFARISLNAQGSSDIDGKIVNYDWYVNDKLILSNNSEFIYNYKLGTNDVKLVVTDDDGVKDSSTTTVDLISSIYQFPKGILGGISALNSTILYTADSSFDPTLGSSITRLDRSAKKIDFLVVQGKIFTTPSVAPDTSVFITNGSYINVFDKKGVSLWEKSLGGISYVTPTIDSNLNRIYLGVSNKNFFAYNTKTGENISVYKTEGPINTSAVISIDRKLIFTDELGIVYGFDISTSSAPSAPKWRHSLGDIVLKSPALDALGRVYIGTKSGIFYKLRLNADGSVTTLWQTPLGAPISSSPVIDRDGFIYVGDEKGNLTKLDPLNGTIVWVYSSGAPIRSTPSISEYRVIYFANAKGLVTALSTEKELKWKYQSDGPVSANILYIDRMLYVGNEKGSYVAIYDNPNSVTVNTSFNQRMPDLKNQFTAAANNGGNGLIIDEISVAEANTSFNTIPESKPIWGTFQGDYRRTGNLSSGCPLSISVTKEADGSLLSNVPTSIQWYRNGEIITGATSASYKPTQPGTYSVKNISSTCSIIESNKLDVLITSITNLSVGEEMSIAPNPFDAQVNLNYKMNGVTIINIRVVEMSTGKIVKIYEKLRSGQTLNVSDIPKGIYIFQCVTPDGRFFKAYKMMKFK